MNQQTLAKILATWFFVGKVPFAPGTFGSLAALPFAYAIFSVFGEWTLLGAAFFLYFMGIWASDTYMAAQSDHEHDPAEIVIDEVAGMWCLLALWQILYSQQFSISSLHWLVGGFIMFRVFDIFKPWPISWVDAKVKGGFGVMIDDILAAIFPMAVFYPLSLNIPAML
ncbi:MAG: phosphatidylglycerophosphatase A [Rickettsiales bacterium]|nr:phosphatidylglycerophosphatase A [Rickettsiales bacterium]